MSANEVIKIVNDLNWVERLKVVEAILRGIRIERVHSRVSINQEVSPPRILELSGIWDENDARIFEEAVLESRKIDGDEW